MSKARTVLVAWICLVATSMIPRHGQAERQFTQLKATVQEELRGLNAVMGTNATITFKDDGGINVAKGREPAFGLGYLAEIVEHSEPERAQDVIRFVIAHELWHQIQFTRHGSVARGGPDAANRSSLTEDSRLGECQADLMAGYYLARLAPVDLVESAEMVSNIMGVVYAVGERPFSNRIHPSKVQRSLAALWGLRKGRLDSVTGEQLVQNIHDLRARMSHVLEGLEDGDEPTQTNVYQARLAARRLINYTPGQSNYDWSLQECKRITNYRSASASHVALRDQDVYWSRDPAPLVQFRLSYENTGASALKVSIGVQLVLVERDSQRDFASSHPVDVFNQVFYLNPQGRHEVRGTFLWLGDVQVFPRLVVPPNTELGALISAEPLSGTNPSHPFLILEDVDLSESARELRDVVQRLALSARERFESERVECTIIRDSMSCRSRVEIPGALETEIELEREGCANIQADLYRGYDLEVARTIFDQYAHHLSAGFPEVPQSLRTSRRSGLPRLKMEMETYGADLELVLFRSSSGHAEPVSVWLEITPRMF